MGSKEEWCADKLSKLLNEDLRISTLNEIKEHMHEISSEEAVQTAEILELPLVFDCLNDSNNEQIELACEVLSFCMEKLDIAETTTKYSISLERALTHPNSGVKLMALEEISRIMKCDVGQKMQLITSVGRRPIFINIIRCIGCADLKVAALAQKIATQFGRVNIDCVLVTESLRVIKEVMAISEVVRLRFYELFVELCISEKNLYNRIVSNGLLNSLIHEIDSNDVLLKLNVIELLNKLVEVDYGYEYLENEGFMEKIFKQILSDEDPLFVQLCEPGIIKFFGHMSHCKSSEIIIKYPKLVERIFLNLESSDYTITKVSLETLAYIASKDKAVLDSFVGNKVIDAIQSIAEKLQHLQTKEKILSLNWVEEILKEPQNENASKICQKWFRAFGEEPMDLVMHYVQNPFEEFRLAGLGILSSLTYHSWGHELIRNHPGLPEYLLNRGSETSKSVKEIKYEIVTNLYEKKFGNFNNAMMVQFEAFVKEGPHYVQTITEVAVEGD